MIINLTAINCLALSGSQGSADYLQGSSYVGKSTLARHFPDRIVVSLAAEIRRCLYQDDRYGDPFTCSTLPKPIESPETKGQLIELGETCNQTEPYGWVLMAVCKMLLMPSQSFVVDDVRRAQESLLLSALGAELIEIARPGDQTRQYGSDGKVVDVYDYRLINRGDAGFFDASVDALNSVAYGHNVQLSPSAMRGIVRLLSQLVSPGIRDQLTRDSAHFDALFAGHLLDDAETNRLHFDGVVSVILALLRQEADRVASENGLTVNLVFQ